MSIERSLRAVNYGDAFAFPVYQILKRRPALAHRKNYRRIRPLLLGFVERDEVYRKIAFPKPMRDLFKKESVIG